MTVVPSAHRPLTRLLAAAAAAVLLLGGCTEPESSGDGGASDGGGAPEQASGDSTSPELEEIGSSAAEDLPADPATDPAYSAYYEQEIEWGPCEDLTTERAECGSLTVPLVWNDPSAGDIEIAVGRIGASGERTGSLVINPGGPGGSGVNFLDSAEYVFSPQMRSSYDVVGFDPRGVNRSAGIECLSDEETDEYLALTVEPGTEEAEAAAEEWGTRIAEACQEHSGDLLPYLDTWSAARDMDVLRAALGTEQLDYLGFSYGTYLGASYAELYPDRVGSTVLDGAMDPTISMNELVAGQTEGFENATGAFLQDCLDAAEGCPFKGDLEEARQQLDSFFSAVDAQPVETDDPERPLTGALARSAFMILLYEDGLWQMGREALTDAMNGDGAALLALADQSSERRADGTYRTNATYAITAVNCLDHPGVADEEWVEQEAQRLAEEYPTFGPMMGGDGCSTWPQQPVREPAPIAAEGAGPILVVGTTGDPATPYAWSQNLAVQLDDAVLLTYEGHGHTAYGRSGGCIEEIVDAYFLEGMVPEGDPTC
ncbi:alpha/beta hydrolase [Brachybacterium sp. YJGR34]|uniref:alpha/beta hydrolase n=1 Tax=Brachybacterium sp. YJGR34 TaxID=2059911 RepID=UPI000E0AA318|nr:alpha/beta hydrolase [Brachybacterium sp. YJGR34]